MMIRVFQGVFLLIILGFSCTEKSSESIVRKHTVSLEIQEKEVLISKEQAIENIELIFDSYVKNQESVDSEINKELMISSLDVLKKVPESINWELLINVWMYYDPTDFDTRNLLQPIFIQNKDRSVQAVENRIKNKKSWETEDLAPYPELFNLLNNLNTAK